MKIDPNLHEYAIRCPGIYCDPSCGPIFGYTNIFGNTDIQIASNSNTNMSDSYLGYNYKHPQYALGTNEAKSFLAGSYQFQLNEIEVYQKE